MRQRALWLASILALLTSVGCGGDPSSPTAPDAGAPMVDAGLVDAGPVPDAPPDDPQPDAMPPPELGPLGPGAATLAGNAVPGAVDGPREVALFNNPVGVAVGPDGDIYVADFNNGLIRRVTTDGEVATLTDQDDFFRPFALTFHSDGRLFVQTDSNDTGDVNVDTGTVWEVSLDTGEAVVVARDLGRPRGLAALSDGRLVLVDYPKHVIHLLDPDAAEPTPTFLAGSSGEEGYADGTGGAARFHRPLGVAVSANDDIYVADRENHCIRKITLDGVVTTVAGTPGVAGSDDGTLAKATFDRPYAMAIDGADNLYVTELGSFLIRRIDLTSDAVSTLAGVGAAGFADDEDPLQAQFFGLEGVDVDFDGTYLYIADGNRGEEPPADFPYHRVRRLSLPAE